jgi:hypothetical protein
MGCFVELPAPTALLMPVCWTASFYILGKFPAKKHEHDLEQSV